MHPAESTAPPPNSLSAPPEVESPPRPPPPLPPPIVSPRRVCTASDRAAGCVSVVEGVGSVSHHAGTSEVSPFLADVSGVPEEGVPQEGGMASELVALCRQTDAELEVGAPNFQLVSSVSHTDLRIGCHELSYNKIFLLLGRRMDRNFHQELPHQIC